VRRETLIRKLIASVRCSVCGKPYRPSNIKVLGHEDNLWFLSVFCPSCRTLGLVAAVVKREAVKRATELTPEEKIKFANARPIGADDVLEMHEFLQNFEGDVKAMFAED